MRTSPGGHRPLTKQVEPWSDEHIWLRGTLAALVSQDASLHNCYCMRVRDDAIHATGLLLLHHIEQKRRVATHHIQVNDLASRHVRFLFGPTRHH